MNMRSIGIVAGVILVVGVLIVGSQYLRNATGGVSADAPTAELIPAEVSMTKSQYQDFIGKFEEYSQATDLATRNEIMTEIRESFYNLVVQ
ncbi:MAG: hypothetical protein PHR51_00030 [Patescibacteria group bacterium]|nr:hypothetical protein [Patescibacteria group bacterium]